MAGGTLLAPLPRWRDDAGDPLAGGQLYGYMAGTNTAAQLYRDAGLTDPHSRPVELDASGRAAIFLDPDVTYRIEVQDRDGNTVETIDGVRGIVPVVAVAAATNFPNAPPAPVGCPVEGQITWVWDYPVDNGAAITSYRLQIREVGRDWGEVLTVAANTYTQDSAERVIYEARVRALNSEGQGPWSQAGRAPEGTAPDRVEVAVAYPASSPRTAFLKWATPNANGAPLQFYEIQWKSGDQDWDAAARQVAVSPTRTTQGFTGLTGGTDYSFRIRAVSSAGAGDWSPVVVVTPVSLPDRQ